MKITLEDKTKLFEMLDKALLPKIEIVKEHRAKKLGNDIEKRFRWDLFHAAKITLGDGKGMSGDINLYAYMNDEHIDTVLRLYVKERPQFNLETLEK